MDALPDPLQNRLLRALPREGSDRVFPNLTCVTLFSGQVLYTPGDPLEHAYFPTDAIISLISLLESGDASHLAQVGNEGMVNVALFLGADTIPNRMVVQSAGFAYRISGHALKRAFHESRATQNLLLRYTQSFLTLISQTGACNRHHNVYQQLSRLLLMHLDRLRGNELAITHEQIASLLGVRREGVTEAAGRLKAQGFIRYSRGRILVLQRRELESATCECYAVVRNEFDRLMPDLRPDAPASEPHSRYQKDA